MSFSALLIIVRQFNRPYITFSPIIITILFSIIIIIKTRPNFSLQIKAVFKFKVKALKTKSNFN